MTQEAVNSAIVLYRLSVDRKDVECTQGVFFTTPKLQKFLKNPTISEQKKDAVIRRIFSAAQIPEKLIVFVQMMSRLGNCGEMQDIFQSYYQYWDKKNHILRAELIYALEPTEDVLKEAKHLLQSKYPEEKIILTQKTDETLLGGYVIRVLHKEYDRSYEGRLRQLEKKLTGR